MKGMKIMKFMKEGFFFMGFMSFMFVMSFF